MYKKLLHGYKNYRIIVTGEVLVVNQHKFYIPKYKISNIDREIKEFEESVLSVKKEIIFYKKELLDPKIGGIFDFYSIFIDEYADTIIKAIENEKLNSAYIINRELKKTLSIFENMKDPLFKQKKEDIEFIVNRILSNLYNKYENSIIKDKIIVAKKISPMDLLLYHKNGAKGIIVEDGSLTSHTTIVANSLDISYVVGINDIMNHVKDKDTLIIDGYSGEIFISPNQIFIEKYNKKALEQIKRYEILKKEAKKEAKTKDGIVIKVMANLDIPNSVNHLSEYLEDGVGLLRSEFMFYNDKIIPTLEEQFLRYKDILLEFENKEITIRTFDFSRDKTPIILRDITQNNPAMGLRGIRFSIKYNLFETQFKALIRASVFGHLNILIPMITSYEEVLFIKNMEKKILSELKMEKKYKLGIMIETPASAFLIDDIYQMIDFISYGTNDLMQFFFATDRSNLAVSDLRDPFAKPFIRFLKDSIERVQKYNIKSSICGEIAAIDEMIPILLAMGLRDISVTPLSIPIIKNIIRTLSIKEVKEKLELILKN